MFVDPSMVVLAGADTAFVSDTTAFAQGGLIAVDLPSGRQTKVAASTVFHRPFGLACQADGQLVVAYMEADHAPGTVMRVNPANGDHHAVAPDVQFFLPVGVALDPADNVIIVENDISGQESVLHRVPIAAKHTESSEPRIGQAQPAGDRDERALPFRPGALPEGAENSNRLCSPKSGELSVS
jgi:DNA-binding beta-propeller fold protein YncE